MRAPAASRSEAASIVARHDPGSVPARSASAIVEADAGLTIGDLPAHDLDRAELVGLAANVAAHPELWRHHISCADGERPAVSRRHYVSLHRDTHVDVWVLCWEPENDTGWHDHDISSGAVAVVTGALTENNLAVDGPGVRTDVEAGQVFGFGPDHIHRLTGRDAGTVSIHAYSPPLWRMGQYTVGSGGMLHRTSVSYADELRPLDGPLS